MYKGLPGHPTGHAEEQTAATSRRMLRTAEMQEEENASTQHYLLVFIFYLEVHGL